MSLIPDATSSSLTDDSLFYYKKGADLEYEGYLEEAVEYYRRALKINPNVEKIYNESFNKLEKVVDDEQISNNRINDKQEEEDQEIVEAFSLLKLPDHVISLIFESVIAKNLDYSYLGKISIVCKKFNEIANSAYLWKKISLRLFRNVDETDINLFHKSPLPRSVENCYGYNSWKNLVLNHPHVLINGIYASKIEYDHRGGMSIDPKTSSLLPSHNRIVRYFRIIRFFNDGYAHMITSSTPLRSILNSFSSTCVNSDFALFDTTFFFRLHPSKGEVNQLPEQSSNYWVGTYIFTKSDQVLCKFIKVEKVFTREPLERRGNFRPITSELIKTEYLISFNVKGVKNRGENIKLSWQDYRIEKFNFQTKSTTCNKIETNNHHFRSFYYFKIAEFSQTNYPFVDGCKC